MTDITNGNIAFKDAVLCLSPKSLKTRPKGSFLIVNGQLPIANYHSPMTNDRFFSLTLTTNTDTYSLSSSFFFDTPRPAATPLKRGKVA